MNSKPVIGLIQFPGSNCERETHLAIERVEMCSIDIFWNSSPSLLDKCDGFVLVGGFSYEDRLRSGVIASTNPIIKALSHQAAQAKPILGLCNGAQILLESGLVPGLENQALAAALYTNIREINNKKIEGGYYNDWCTIKPMFVSKSHAFTNQFKKNQSIHVPFAHAQGRFVLEPELFEEMQKNASCMFQYQDKNPNGSVYDLAAISNKSGNVMAMMPHPERSKEGDLIFLSMREYIASSKHQSIEETYNYAPPSTNISLYSPPSQQEVFLIDLLIEDKTAKTLELLLTQNNFDAKVKRLQFWQVESDLPRNVLLTNIKDSAELLNTSKEKCVAFPKRNINYLICDKADVLGTHKTKVLQDRFEMKDIKNIKHGILFCFEIDDSQRTRLNDFLINNHLLYNHFVQDCYEYNKS